jgi:hypothetical protein
LVTLGLRGEVNAARRCGAIAAASRLRQPSADLGTQHLLTVTTLLFSQNPVRAA